MFKLFKDKEQENKIKYLPVPELTRNVTQTLKLSSIRINYDSEMFTKKYRAQIVYNERPRDWTNRGITDEVEIVGDNWEDLIEKVSIYFEQNNE